MPDNELADKIDCDPYGEVIKELRRLGQWVRAGDYERDDARDEIARAIENRIRQLELMLTPEQRKRLEVTSHAKE